MTKDDHGTRILIADDHEMLLEAFRMFMHSVGGYEVVTAPTLDDALTAMRTEGPFAMAILDWNMPGMMGVQGLRRAMSVSASRPVGILTGEVSPRAVSEIVAAGAAGIVLKSSGLRAFVSAINLMLNGERYLPFDLLVAQRDGEEQQQSSLTTKETQVLAEIARGRANKEICHELKLSLPTVKMHITSICRKLTAKNRLHASVIARDLGII